MYFLAVIFFLFLTTAKLQPSAMAQSSFPIRTFAFTSDTSFNFDLNLVIPIPVIGNITVEIEFDLPLRFRFLNSSVAYMPIKIPYFILPDPKPITIDLTHNSNHDQSYYSYDQDPFNYDSYYAPEYNSPYYDSSQTWVDTNRRNLLSSGNKKKSTKNLLPNGKRRKSKKNPKQSKKNEFINQQQRGVNFNETFRYYHRRHKRSVAEASAQHRIDLFTVIEETLNMYGFDGQACVCRAVCEIAEMHFLIESPAHEAVEHLLR